ncbi:hypothetical protein PAEPH01_1686 [Pancytospora epiphaga]|nr:hypothetical protein PAEPH01_1686 [Pancytospora epiphaga]
MAFFQMLIAFIGLMTLANCGTKRSTLEVEKASDVEAFHQRLDIAHKYIAMVERPMAKIEEDVLEIPLDSASKDTTLTKQGGCPIPHNVDALETGEGGLILMNLDLDTLTDIREILDEEPDLKISPTDIVPLSITDNKAQRPDDSKGCSLNKSENISKIENFTKEEYQFESDGISGFDTSDYSSDDVLNNTQEEHAYSVITDSNYKETVNPIDSDQVTGMYGHETATSLQESAMRQTPLRPTFFHRV